MPEPPVIDKRFVIRCLAIAWVISNLIATFFCAGGSLVSMIQIALERMR